MRHYLTTWFWYQDRLCSLGSCSLVGLSLFCLAGIGTLGWALLQFLDDLAYLLAENDPKTLVVLLGILLASSAALWVLSCCLGVLAQRILLRRRGL